MFKGKLKNFTSIVKTASVLVLLSQYYGYLIHIILEICSEFHVIDVGFINETIPVDISSSSRK